MRCDLSAIVERCSNYIRTFQIGKQGPINHHPILDENQIYGAKVDLRIDNELFRLKQGRRGELI